MAQVAPPELEQTDEGCPEQQITEYLERHGYYGRIDPELMLQRSREIKEMLDRERFQAKSIGGDTWMSIGPTNGAGRATAVAPHPSIKGTAIIGAAGGGAWKTTDGGQSWRALTDDIPNLSVGAVSYAPSNPSVVYLGTGEGGYAGDFIPGIGLLASSDGGDTWKLPDSVIATEFYRLSVNPADPNDVLAGTNAGMLHSKNGQAGPWESVIATSVVNGAAAYGDVTDIVRDPTDAKTIYATTWDRRAWCISKHCPFEFFYSTPTVMKSVDGGDTWTAVGPGLPASTPTMRVNRLSIAIAPSSPSTLYVATSTLDSATGQERSHVYKSVDAGATWTETALATAKESNLTTYLGTQAWYDNIIVVSPSDPNIVTVGGVTYARTTDGGITWTRGMANAHVDAHEFRYDNFGTLWLACDGGIWSSADDGASATAHNTGLVTRQFYAMANDPANRNRIYGGQQDNGTIMRGDLGGSDWSPFTGGDGFACTVNPAAPSIAFSTAQGGIVLRTVTAGTLNRTVLRLPPYEPFETLPFYSIVVTDPQHPSTVYTVSSRVWQSKTGGDGWIPLSLQISNGTQVPSNASIRTLAIAPGDSNVMMFALASPQRRVFRTTDGGAQWVETTVGLPTGRTILHLEIDPRDTQHVFATISGTIGASMYMTTDGGTTWQERATGLPPFSAQTVRFDPTDSQTLYAGTDVGVYRTTDGGATWSRFGSGMPAVSVYDVEPLRDGTILRAATHGRGVWELAIPSPPNTPPHALITEPSSHQMVIARGATVSFTGSISDPDGDATSSSWTFSDTWTSVAAADGVTVKHTFDRAGRYVAGLSATDARGGIGASTVEVDVVAADDACSAAVAMPSDTFPLSVTVDTDLASKEATDPHTLATCYPFNPASSTWLTFTAPETGQYSFSLFGSEVSAILVGYTGSCGGLLQNAICMARADNEADALSSTQTVTLSAGEPIHLLVANYYSNDFGPVTVTIAKSAPSIVVTRIAPATGEAGTAIVINGSGFQSGATVTVGGVAATNVAWISQKLLTATVGVRGGGDADVVVKNPDGTMATLEAGFTFTNTSGPRRRVVKP